MYMYMHVCMCACAGEILCIGAGAKPGAHPPPEHCLQRPKGMYILKYYLMSVSICIYTCTCKYMYNKYPIIGSSTVVDHETYIHVYTRQNHSCANDR